MQKLNNNNRNQHKNAEHEALQYSCLLTLFLAVLLSDDPVIERSICGSKRHKRLKLKRFKIRLQVKMYIVGGTLFAFGLQRTVILHENNLKRRLCEVWGWTHPYVFEFLW